jgi:hypothetical protein
MRCPYKDIFGIPGTGFHSQRFMGLALNDTLGTIVLAVLVTYFFNVSLWKSIIGMFLLGEILHYVFGVQTAFLNMIGIKACEETNGSMQQQGHRRMSGSF